MQEVCTLGGPCGLCLYLLSDVIMVCVHTIHVKMHS